MATIVTRSGKGSPLTNTEVDSNFSNLNTDKLEDITGESIKDLSDVYSAMSPTDGQVLTYDTTNGWQAEDAAGGAATVEPIVYNLDTVSSALTIDSGENGFSVGNMTISTGGSVTIADGQKWLIADGNITSDVGVPASTGKAIAMSIVFGG